MKEIYNQLTAIAEAEAIRIADKCEDIKELKFNLDLENLFDAILEEIEENYEIKLDEDIIDEILTDVIDETIEEYSEGFKENEQDERAREFYNSIL